MRNILFFIIGSILTAGGGCFSYADDSKNVDCDLAYAKSLQNVYAHAAEKALPAVVIIKTAKRIKQYYYLQPRFTDLRTAFVYRFFYKPQIIEREKDER